MTRGTCACPCRVYGSWEPPSYKLSAIQGTPLAIFSGLKDDLGDPVDIGLLLKRLPPGSVVHTQVERTYAHLDFVWWVGRRGAARRGALPCARLGAGWVRLHDVSLVLFPNRRFGRARGACRNSYELRAGLPFTCAPPTPPCLAATGVSTPMSSSIQLYLTWWQRTYPPTSLNHELICPAVLDWWQRTYPPTIPTHAWGACHRVVHFDFCLLCSWNGVTATLCCTVCFLSLAAWNDGGVQLFTSIQQKWISREIGIINQPPQPHGAHD